MFVTISNTMCFLLYECRNLRNSLQSMKNLFLIKQTKNTSIFFNIVHQMSSVGNVLPIYSSRFRNFFGAIIGIFLELFLDYIFVLMAFSIFFTFWSTTILPYHIFLAFWLLITFLTFLILSERGSDSVSWGRRRLLPLYTP